LTFSFKHGNMLFNMSNYSPLRRKLSLAGLLLILAFFMWLAIQAVQILPSATSTLASLANSVYNYNPREIKNFSVVGPTSMVISGDVFNLTWPELRIPGQYSFSYKCNPGVSANIRSEDRTFTEATCGKSYDLGTSNRIEVAFSSERARFAEIDYTINFHRTNATSPTATASGIVTIINSSLSLSGELITQVPTATSTATTTDPKPDVSPENNYSSTTATVATSTPTQQATSTLGTVSTSTVTVNVAATNTPPIRPTTPPTTLVPSVVYTYAIPVSRDDGFTDLSVSHLGVGTFSPTGQFINTGRIQTLSIGAIQFNVHNIGTRTSETWRYRAELPNGQIYTSSDQAPLKPNERAVLTLGFPALTDTTELARFGVSIETSRDTNTTNNSFAWSTLITR